MKLIYASDTTLR